MFSVLLHNLTSALNGSAENASWRRVVDAFVQKHPDVLFCEGPLRGEHAPGAFIVWKFGGDDWRVANFSGGDPVPAGSYGVQLFPSREEAEAEAYGKRFGADGVAFASNAAEAGDRTVITGIGSFDAAAPAGELSSGLCDGSFSMLVLYEDSPSYASQPAKRRAA
jgi:hypothetical protein